MNKLLILFALLAFGCQGNTSTAEDTAETVEASVVSLDDMIMAKEFHDFKLNDIDGNEVNFADFKGKKVLLVNVASKCGYTPQYAELQELHEKHGDELLVLGFPANNFGGQEPGTEEDIKAFCTENYGVTFPMFEKVSVKGVDKHPLYRWLSDKDMNGWNDKEPSWNFCKYLVDENGELIEFYPSSVSPMDKEITKHLDA
ncbi:glutathione peroxidase [Litoribacter ruber]|uniref:Glutathione peroxidase n=1 Tax=Litoribacter ruber TaxID=702568 RepID=A0AAP2G3K5_9BACT|nr:MULTISPECIES: glutathione peroxidase [Litoribacter]MBS9523101.1 glutathione peroxidase [Litoribacter alkaliphilus]MBT0810736.1 glutathione peroxidase [Litoribacter ruber]